MLTRRALCRALAAAPLLVTLPHVAQAASHHVELLQATITEQRSGLFLSASWDFTLANTLIESLNRGISLYFVTSFRIQKKRWYWFDRDVVDVEHVLRVSFSPLSRNYRLSSGGLSQTFDSLEHVLALVRHVREWRVCDVFSMRDPDDYEAEIRLRLDASRLPKPLQVSIGGNTDWDIDSDWISVALPSRADAAP